MRSMLVMVSLVGLLFIASAMTQSRGQGAGSDPVRWEYLYSKAVSKNDANKLGERGWELVLVHREGETEKWIFKRPAS